MFLFGFFFANFVHLIISVAHKDTITLLLLFSLSYVPPTAYLKKVKSKSYLPNLLALSRAQPKSLRRFLLKKKAEEAQSELSFFLSIQKHFISHCLFFFLPQTSTVWQIVQNRNAHNECI